MSSITTPATTQTSNIQASKPSFLGLVNSELFRIRKMWTIWAGLIVMLAIMCMPYVITSLTPSRGDELKAQPLHFLGDSIGTNLFVMRVFIGFFVILLTANVFGREYQLGTIRILLARGVGRLQLLFAKTLAVVTVALIAFVLCLLLNVIGQYAQMLILAGNTNGLSSITGDLWGALGVYLLTILASMGVTMLLTIAVTAIGRSLAFGLSISLMFFPVDNIGTLFMSIGYRLTHNDFWKNITAYFLGPNLNIMPNALYPTKFENLGAAPLVPVDASHTIWVACIYAAIFAVIALVLTWKRDVRE